MTETIQQLKEDIAILQEKLRKLEEHQMTLENEGEFDMVSYNNEIYYRMEFPTGANWWKRDLRTDTMMMVDNETLEQYYQEQVVAEREREMIKRNLKTSLQEMVNGDVRPIDDVVKEAKEEQKWDVVRESVKWCEENPEKSVEDYLTPKTPEKTEQSLKTAFKEAQQTEKWKETQKKIDTPKESWMDKPIDELVDKLMENPPDCLKFQLGKTLEQIIHRWWCDTFSINEKWSVDECIDDLIDQVEIWMPREQSAEGSQDLYACIAVDAENDLLKKIKSKLRNKKDT
jgi:hypothetical protein